MTGAFGRDPQSPGLQPSGLQPSGLQSSDLQAPGLQSSDLPAAGLESSGLETLTRPARPTLTRPRLDTADQALAKLAGHPGWAGRCLGGTRGFTLPDPTTLRPVALTEANVERLLAANVELSGAFGENNVIWLPAEPGGMKLRVQQYGHSGCRLIFGRIGHGHMKVSLEGPDHLLVMADTRQTVHIIITMRHRRGALLLGRGLSSNGTDCLIEGPDCALQVGDDAMWAVGTKIRTSDSHGIIDLLDGGRVLNRPAPVTLASHVWLGAGVTVMKGTQIGRGGIVGAGAVVTADIPARSLAVGVPARVLRSGVTWTRASQPNAAQVDEAMRAVGAIPSRP